jgi:HTH-type transcriptional regulator / antitoxin MqsA
MRMRDGTICPACEEGRLAAVQKEVKFVYKGKETIVDGRAFECPVCCESFWDRKDERELEKSLTDMRRRIDGLLTSGEIKQIRVDIFGMNQVDFAKAMDFGEKNFARYENGQATQSRAVDNLLRVLRDFPEALMSFCRNWPDLYSASISMKVHHKQRTRKRPYCVVKIEGCQISDQGIANVCGF